MFGVPFSELPPEIQAQFKEQFDEQQMVAEDRVNLLEDFFDGLTKDQYKALDIVFNDINDHLLPQARLGFYIGYITGKHEEKFDHECLVHGVNHRAERLKNVPRPEKSAEPEIKWEGEDADVEAVNLRNRQMIEYRLVEDEESKLHCKDCGHDYSSLEDRMVKSPDECAGCEQKAKWG